jgi:hypothetical protein
MVDRRDEQPLGYSNGWAFLGNALTSPRQAFERAQNVSYWWPACGVTAVYVLLGYLAGNFTTAPILVGVPLFTGLFLLVELLVTAVARAVCGGHGAEVGPAASKVALVTFTINIPGSALEVAIGADAVLVAVVLGISWVVSAGYLTVLFSAAFEAGLGRAFGGVLVGHLAFIVLGIGVVGCLGFLATA